MEWWQRLERQAHRSGLTIIGREADTLNVMQCSLPTRPRWPALLALTLLSLTAGTLPLWAGVSAPLPGDSPIFDFPENAEFRRIDYDSFINARTEELRGAHPLLLRNGWAEWKREVIASGNYQYIVYAAGRDGKWPLYSQGTWIIKRRFGSDEFSQVKIFLKSDPGTYIRIRPDADRSRLDLVIKGGVFAMDTPLPLSFSRILVSTVADIVDLTRGSLDWSLLDPDPADYGAISTLDSEIRSRLRSLRYADDGGLDAQGKPVFIASGERQAAKTAGLNCSGFAQWVVDGLVKPVSGEWLDRSTLSLKRIATRKSAAEPSFEDSLDPYFGLDWTRNLALAAGAVLEGLPTEGPKAADVTRAPFALVEGESAPVNGDPAYRDFAPYEEDAGFASEGIPALLWWLAIKDPGYFYLASISAQDMAGLRHHYHVSLLLPWFDSGGTFHADVFESDAETSLAALIQRTKGQMIHLVRVKAEIAFDPPALGPTQIH